MLQATAQTYVARVCRHWHKTTANEHVRDAIPYHLALATTYMIDY
jgi:hypothetical protein